MKEKIIGIDLGSSLSVAAIKRGDNFDIIPNIEGERLTPSIVAFTKNKDRLVGGLAKRQAIVNPERTISVIKRHMGSDYKINIDEIDYTPQQISAMILQKIKTDAEDYLGEKVTKAVITVPAYFTDAQRQATKDAGTIAGLDVIRIINEPTAACLTFGITNDASAKILVVDCGGSTTDFSILDVGDGVFEVIATSGDNYLGGVDWDEAIANYIISEYKNTEGIDLSKDKTAMQRLLESSEKAKIELGSKTETEISLPFITANADGPKHLEMKLSRSKFEQLSEKLINRFIKPLKDVISESGLKISEIDKVVFAGGSTRLLMIQDVVKEITGKDPIKGINPDECVAIGAAIQAAILSGEKTDIVLVDVVPLSLGIETMGSINTILIEKNSAIPISKKQTFSTAMDNQPAVDIVVLQGERTMSNDNIKLGTFNLDGILPAPRGVPQIEVTFDIDTNGIVNVSAKDLGTNKEQNIVIQSSNLSAEEIEKYKAEAELYAEEDKNKRDLIDLKNNVEAFKYSAHNILKNEDSKLGAEDKNEIENAIGKMDEAIKTDDFNIIKESFDNFQKTIHTITAKMYVEENKSTADVDYDEEGEIIDISPEDMTAV